MRPHFERGAACRGDDGGCTRGSAQAEALDWDSPEGLASLAQPPIDLVVASGEHMSRD